MCAFYIFIFIYGVNLFQVATYGKVRKVFSEVY